MSFAIPSHTKRAQNDDGLDNWLGSDNKHAIEHGTASKTAEGNGNVDHDDHIGWIEEDDIDGPVLAVKGAKMCKNFPP